MDMRLLNNYILLSTIIVVVIFSFPYSSFTQWYYSLYLEQEFNDNPFGIPDPQSDQITRISMGLQKQWESVEAQYYGSFVNFLQNSDRNFYWHQFFVGGGEETSWNLSLENRINRPDYNLYDYFTGRLGITHTIQQESGLLRLNGSFSLNNFSQIPELNNVFLSAYASYNRSFQTRTSFIGTLSLNYKYYLEKDITAVPPDSTTNALFNISGINQGGMGPGPGGGGHGGGYYYTPSTSEVPQVAQIFLSARIAQSLSKSTGLAAQYSNRFNLNSYDRSIAGLIPGYSTESQIFDDPMSYEAQIYGLELTQLLPFQMSLKGAGYYQEKQYVAQGIYLDQETFDESVLREDSYKTFWITLEKRFNFNLFTDTSLSIQVYYQWVDNQSNSYWYDYISQNFSIGLQLDI
jgi:hypothetical protein